MRKEKSWYWDFWEEVLRFQGVKITRDRFTLDVLCCMSLLLFFFFTKNWPLSTCYFVCRTFIVSFFVQLIIHDCFFFFLLYLGLYLCCPFWAKFTGVDPQFVCVEKSENDSRKTIDCFAISVFPSVFSAVEPHGKPGFVWNFKCRGVGRWFVEYISTSWHLLESDKINYLYTWRGK